MKVNPRSDKSNLSCHVRRGEEERTTAFKPWESIGIFAILLIGGILRFHNTHLFHFDFDQQVSADSAYNFFIAGKISLIGQELSFPGFFLGPLNDWIGFIPYGFCHLKPDCMPFFTSAIGLIILLVSFFLLKAIYGAKIATIVSGILAISSWQILFDLNPNSNFFILLSSILILYAINKFLSGNQKYLILGAFVSGISTVNFNPVFIFTAIAFFATSLIKIRQVRLLILFLALGAFFINYVPIVIFNSRHQNIIYENLLKFLAQNTGIGFFRNPFDLFAKTILPFYSNYFFTYNQSILGLVLELIIILLAIFGAFKLNIKNNVKHSFLIIWLITATLGFIIYKGHVPEYYFLQTILPFVIIISFALKANIYLFLTFVSIFTFLNLHEITGFRTLVNYEAKKKIVNYIISDTDAKSFSLIYEMPLGFETGYEYLFKINNKAPQENGVNSYVIGVGKGAYSIKEEYQKKFPPKRVDELKIKEGIYVVSIK